MDRSNINEWLQVIGLFGVVASLVFVGLQMKQDREIAMAEAFQARAQASAGTLITLSQHDAYLAAVTNQFADDPVPSGRRFAFAPNLRCV